MQAAETTVAPLRHALYLHMRAALGGALISYGYWYLAHHAHQFLWLVVGLLIIIVGMSAWTSRLTFGKLYRLHYQILPVLLFVSSLFFFLLLKNPAYQLVFVVMIGGMYWYLFRVFAELREHATVERKKAFTQSLDILSAFTSFLVFASLQQLLFFFSLHISWFLIAGVFLTALLLYQSYWYHRMVSFRSLAYVLLGSLLVGQFLWAFTLLPTGYLTNAVLSVAVYHSYQTITVAALRGILGVKLVRDQVAISLIVVALVLASSRWIPLF